MPHILVTRHQPEAEETATRLRETGFEPVLSPARSLVPVSPSLQPGSFDAVIVTSRNALHDRVDLPSDVLETRVFCVGDRTAQAARGVGFDHVIAGNGNAATLVETVAAACPRKARVLYLAGEPRRDTVETGLAALGFRVETQVAYRMIRADRLTEEALTALHTGSLAAILHFSAESARDFFELAASHDLEQAAANPHHLCLSEAVAEAVLAKGVAQNHIWIAGKPDQDSLLALLQAPLTT